MTREIIDWNHATELLKQHSGSKCHQDSSITARMAKHVEQQMKCNVQVLRNKLMSKRKKIMRLFLN